MNIDVVPAADSLELWCAALRAWIKQPGSLSTSSDRRTLPEHVRGFVSCRLLNAPSVSGVNGRHPLTKLPLSILVAILLFSAHGDSLALTSTCRSLRTRCAALKCFEPIISVLPSDYPRRYIPKPSPSSLARAAEVASRGRYLQSVTLTWWPELHDALAHFLLQHMPRIRALKVFVPDSRARSPTSVRLMYAALGVPAPVLRSLHVVVRYDESRAKRASSTLEGALLAQYCGASLATLRIAGMGLALAPSVVLPNLRQFCWAPDTFDRAALLAVTASMPRLETLRIHTRVFSWDTSGTPVRSSLKTVYLDAFRDVRNPLAFLRDTRLPRLVARSSRRIHGSRELLTTLTEAASAIAFGYLLYEFTIAGLGAVVRCPTSPKTRDRDLVDWTPVPVAASHARLTSLTLHELAWPLAKGSTRAQLEFAALARLRVSLACCRAFRCMDILSSDGRGIFAAGLQTFRTPALRLLEISYYNHTLPGPGCEQWDSLLVPDKGCFCACTVLSVCLEDVHRFVATCVSGMGGRLERISLNGVEAVDVDPVAYFVLLEQLASSVIVSPDPRPNGCDLGATFALEQARYDQMDEEP